MVVGQNEVLCIQLYHESSEGVVIVSPIYSAGDKILDTA